MRDLIGLIAAMVAIILGCLYVLNITQVFELFFVKENKCDD
jgi:hypothetical protein